MEQRISDLGDVALLVEYYFKNHGAFVNPDDSWNPCAFCVEHIESSFGWSFQNIPKPTIDELEAIKVILES